MVDSICFWLFVYFDLGFLLLLLLSFLLLYVCFVFVVLFVVFLFPGLLIVFCLFVCLFVVVVFFLSTLEHSGCIVDHTLTHLQTGG